MSDNVSYEQMMQPDSDYDFVIFDGWMPGLGDPQQQQIQPAQPDIETQSGTSARLHPAGIFPGMEGGSAPQILPLFHDTRPPVVVQSTLHPIALPILQACPFPDCQKTFSDHRSILEHVHDFTDGHRYSRIPCPAATAASCSSTFSWRDGAIRHYREKHGVDRNSFLCPVKYCPKGVVGGGFDRMYRLVSHLTAQKKHGMKKDRAEFEAARWNGNSSRGWRAGAQQLNAMEVRADANAE